MPYDAVARWHWNDRAGSVSRYKMARAPMHAAVQGALETLCGQPRGRMEKFGAWPEGPGGQCQECAALVDADLPELS